MIITTSPCISNGFESVPRLRSGRSNFKKSWRKQAERCLKMSLIVAVSLLLPQCMLPEPTFPCTLRYLPGGGLKDRAGSAGTAGSCEDRTCEEGQDGGLALNWRM